VLSHDVRNWGRKRKPDGLYFNPDAASLCLFC
jgi:hypothetical protein